MLEMSSIKSQHAASAVHKDAFVVCRVNAVGVGESDIGTTTRDDAAPTEVAAVKGDAALAVAHNRRSCKSSAPLMHPHVTFPQDVLHISVHLGSVMGSGHCAGYEGAHKRH
jgi:hypothetical protein